ncbi:MAG: hypothetical protein Q7T72_04600 [Bacteroidales bacterium]|nr:hypothetical protein [Bacteroidales bacterium]
MKKFSLFLIVIFLITIGSSFQQVTAQEKTKAEQEKEIKIQQAIDLQKKAMTDQKKAQEESAQILKEQQVEVDEALKEVRVEVESAGRAGGAVRIYNQRGNRSFANGEPFEFSTPYVEFFNGHLMGGDSERTTWDFSKSVKEKTFTSDYTFDVEKSVNTVVMSVMGDCKAGEIRIKIVMPNGKNYSDIVIDESGNLNWRKSFTISETENQDKTGEWKFKIDSNKATGFFKISLQSY